jgi:hypothetical protein
MRRAKDKDALTGAGNTNVRRMPKTAEIKELYSHARSTDTFIRPSGSRARVGVPSVSIVSLDYVAV